MEELVVKLLILIACILYLGVGYVSAMVIDFSDSHKKNRTEFSIGIRLALVFVWPFWLLFYLVNGASENK